MKWTEKEVTARTPVLPPVPVSLTHRFQAIRAACKRITGDSHLADDALQNAFVRLLRGGFSCPPWPPWRLLRDVATKAAIDIVRVERHQHPSGALQDSLVALAASESWDPCVQLACHDDLVSLQVWLRYLPVNQRIIVRMKVWEEMSLASISRKLGISESAVRDRWFRGLEQLRWRAGAFLSDHART